MTSRNDGIQLLLQAEKSASEKVNEAKRRKAKRLKEAKIEAQAEIDAERAERERHFKMIEERVLGRRSEIEAQIKKLTDEIIATQSASVKLHKEDAIDLLMSLEHKAELHYKCTKIAEEVAKAQNCTIDLEIVCLATELLFRFHQVLATDLETFAKHAKRTTINMDDVLCFVRRNPQLLPCHPKVARGLGYCQVAQARTGDVERHRSGSTTDLPVQLMSDFHKQQTTAKKQPGVVVPPTTSAGTDSKNPEQPPSKDSETKTDVHSPDSAHSLTEWFMDLE
ncbi:hypothetical protein T265_11215 [Opisthorchis viverrini]|uniref:Centromere protein S n=1 Tax=Opisthorchis viverrini TaxID=6198 RepID=A0A074YZV1_OPIVI|nr:hypothetical protein T265_11215 [Opisthorchis viverrini]KER20178.1 hypothetical protein T265_11215 [Opisthorchis viverrini]